ncbi:MAG TPA: hypothetical protein VN895_04125 [Candidatus Acidoferrum sp.]|nr:hypothetical protein [Candidatus Acidoferrum sp.]
MGGACLRGDGHHWPAGGSRRAPARRWRQGQLTDEPDAARAHPGPQLLRAGGDAHAVHQRVTQGHGNAVAHADCVCVRLALGERNDQRLGDAVPVAHRDGDAVTIAQRQRESVDLALA